MKIVHIAPNSPYDSGWGFHENLLPKHHHKLGHEVTLLVTNLVHDGAKIIETNHMDTINDDGVKVIRIRRKKYFHRVITGMCSKLDVYDYLQMIRPDFIFYHGMVSITIMDVVRYKNRQNPECVIVQDNHIDENNKYKTSVVKEIILRSFYRGIVRKTIPYISKVYGVTPNRKTYANEYYRVPKEKLELLIMGADDEKLDFDNKSKIREEIRKEHKIEDHEYLVVTGGKINSAKSIHTLMEACKEMTSVKLLIFGSVSAEFIGEFKKHLHNANNIVYIGWISAEKVYDYFFAADLIVFPGGHSVMWEQACASKVPCVFRKIEGMDHLNNGGNCEFIDVISVATLSEKIKELKFTDKYYKMKEAAESNVSDIFRYSYIAKKSLECTRIGD